MLFALLLAASEAARPVALLPLRPLGVPQDVVSALQVTLRNEVEDLPEARLVPVKEVPQECLEKLTCAASAASRAGARQVILGTVSQLGDAYMIDLKLLDARNAQELRRATHPVSGSRDALIETLREAAVELLAPSRFVGGLAIDIPDAPGAAVFIDGKEIGIAPLKAPIQGLVPGQHTLRVLDKGRELSTFVEVHYGRISDARVELGPVRIQKSALPVASGPEKQAARTKPAWVRPAAVAAIGLAVITAGIAAVYQVRGNQAASAINQREALNLLTPGDLASYGEVTHDTHFARGYFIASTTLAVTGGALLYWDLR